MSEPRIEVRKVRKVYPGGVVALDGVSLSVQEGEFVAVVGPSGSGKTTLLNLMGLLDDPTEGEVWIRGRPVLPDGNHDLLRAKEVGFVFQLHNLIPTLTCEENVEVPMVALRMPPAERRRRARELLETVGLGHRASFRATNISGGERQRVAVARALANHPGILLADEPTGNLDSRTGKEIVDLMVELKRKEGLALIVVTHNSDVAARADRCVEIRDGRIAPT